MKKILFLTLIIILTSCYSTQKVTAVKNNKGHLVGIATKNNFKQEPYASDWFNDGYKYYKVNKSISEKLKPLLKDVEIKAFIGTWCGDSKRETPIFYKILDKGDFNYKNLTMVTLNRAKKAHNLEKGYNILRVPTFIFFKNGKEIGRFVEHSVDNSTVEKDFLQILSGKLYKHPYQK
ncbi:MAG: thioredoxin family protein [Tenacibaculum sp.]|nr:thioredoxin family protein [Tenacibaculum sp.]